MFERFAGESREAVVRARIRRGASVQSRSSLSTSCLR